MKIKVLLILALFALGCAAASGQSYGPFAYLDSSGTFYYCETGTYTVNGVLAVGQKNLSVCGFPDNGVWVGFKASIGAASLQPVTGSVLELADNELDAEFASYSGCQAEFVTKTKASLKKFGWAFYFTCDGLDEAIADYGYVVNDAEAKASGQAHTTTTMIGLRK